MNWPMLPNDLWSLIGSKLDVAADRVRFLAVCKSMSSVLPFPQPIWLMLSQSQQHNKEGEGEEGVVSPPPRRGFVVVGEQHIYQLALPEAHDARCVGSTGTWLITVDLYNNICMLNAFSRIQIHLPSQSTFQDSKRPTPKDERDSFLRKIVLSSSENTNCIMAVAIYHRMNQLAFAMPGDSSWTKIDEGEDFFDDVIFFKDKLYLVNSYGAVVSYDFGDDPSRRSYEISWITDPCKPLEPDPCTCHPKKYYLVEWLDELLLVTRHIRYLRFVDNGEDGPAIYHTVQVEVHKLDFSNMNWVELNNLEEYSLFLGLNTSVSVHIATYNGSLKRNCIYFTDDYTGACWMGYFERGLSRGYDMVMYDLDDRSLQPYYRGLSEYSCSPPIWIVPSPLSVVK